ncbi:RING finger protein [Mycena sanguinolenta]|uniref:RBR-type E3 ubiquitin transferase n=1 Tax=Mycena sanguinolenta TaxID=230812 RepID=A0A8H7DDH3_9AGAR|nr:RING finger protein [Mycena sanguinolenta]
MIKRHSQDSLADLDSQHTTAIRTSECIVNFKPRNQYSDHETTYFPAYHIQASTLVPVRSVDTQTTCVNPMDPWKPAMVRLPHSAWLYSTQNSMFKYISWDEPPDCNPRQTPNIKHPTAPLANQETCRNWLRNRCNFGSRCKWLHSSLNHDIANSQSTVSFPPEPHLSITLRDHTKVKIGPGFEVLEVTPNVETPWIILSKVPAHIKANAIKQLVSPFGPVVDVQLETPETADNTIIAKVGFSDHREAVRASQSLNGYTFANAKISAQPVPINQPREPSIQNCSAQIQWETPHKVGYGGYPNLERAHEAMAVAAQGPSDDYHVSASIHVGLPRFAAPEDIMWERPNYTVLGPAVNGIKNILRKLPNFVQLEVQPPPYSYGRISAWATFSSPATAKAGARVINGQVPFCTGKTRIWARHVYSIDYHPSVVECAQNTRLIDDLGESIFRDTGIMAVSTRKLPSSSSMVIRLSAGGLKGLGNLQSEVAKILRGEIIRCDGIVVWDSFFAGPEGLDYFHGVEANEPGVRIEADKVKRTLKVFGATSSRAAVRAVLVRKVADLKTAERTSTVRVPGSVLGAFIATQLSPLCEKFGSNSISVDIEERTVTLRGGDGLSAAYEAAVEAVTQTQQSPLSNGECLVCFSAAVAPITLRCGHTWCREHLTKYLLVAVLSDLHFPLPCPGANCTKPISLRIVRSVLRPSEFNSLVEASIGAYMHAHAEQFQFCPSSGCMQFYRTSTEPNFKSTVIQCASCLMHICSRCQSEAHEGFGCAEQGLE